MARLWRDSVGTAAVELCIASCLLFMALVPVVDYSAYALTNNQIQQAAYRSSLLATANAQAIDTTVLGNYATNSLANARLSGVTTTLTCNGVACSNSVRTPMCLAAAGGAFSLPISGGCSAGDPPGYFLKITVRGTYRSILPGLSPLQSSVLQAGLVVRLQ